MIQQWNLKLFGLVQGVCVRINVQDKVKNFMLKGNIKNLNDGSVEINIVGEEKKLSNFYSWLKTGPGSSNIVSIDKKVLPRVEKFDDFEILY